MSKEHELYKTADDGGKPDWLREQAVDGLGKLDSEEANKCLGSLARDGGKPDWLREKALAKLSEK